MARVTSFVVCAALLVLVGPARAGSSVDDLKKEVEKLRREIAQKQESRTPISGKVDELVGSKYGPGSAVVTKSGKLQIGGLLQVWFQSVQNDRNGIINGFGPADNLAFAENFSPSNNDTFRVRRTELRFTMDIHENILAHVMMDPTRESNVTFYPLPTYPNHNERLINNFFIDTGSGIQAGNTILPSLLQDAYINYHGVVPHHDFTIGQFKPPSGEEAWRNSGQLEFVERAMVTNINNVRDIGVMLHGTWVDNRVQYWVGGFNGPAGTVLGNPELLEGGNRADDNSSKDIAWRVAVKPVWTTEEWYGRLELGYARTDGYRGEDGDQFDDTVQNNSINEKETPINRQAAWAWYRPNGPVKGAWFRGEWGSGRDRYSPTGSFGGVPTVMLGTGSGLTDNPMFAGAPLQLAPTPVSAWGLYAGTGYKVSDGIFAEKLRGGNSFEKFLYDLEFAFRYEQYQNIATESVNNPDRQTDLFITKAYTAGINYYVNLHGGKIRAHDVKIQANYIIVDDPHNSDRGLREVKNNVFVLAFQVMF